MPTDGFSFTLPDGAPILLRPVTPGDKERFRQAPGLLSSNSMYTRFFEHLESFSEDRLEYFTNVDQQDHVAWGALSSEDTDFPGLGTGRFIRLPGEPEVAEIAITIIDDWQRRGLGMVLMGLMYLIAPSRGVKAFEGVLVMDNEPVVRALEVVGARVRFDGEAFNVRLDIEPDWKSLPDNPLGKAFKQVLAQLEPPLKALDEGWV